MSARTTTPRQSICLVLAALAVALIVPATASGAGRLYWANFGAPERISFANLDGSAGTNLNLSGALVKIPIGLALDPAGGRAYWTNESAPGGISYANLDGTGGGNLATGAATVKGPSGAAIDPVGHRVYWGNIGDGTISYANLDGSGGGNLNTGTATVSGPYQLEVDPASKRVYWTNTVKAGTISYANLDGSGGADLPISGSATLEYPFGLAIDPVGKRIYWVNSVVSGKVSYANLDGSGSADLNTAGATVSESDGIAVDPEAHRVYWANSGGGLASADTAGAGGTNLPIAGGFASGSPNSPNLLLAPVGTAAPTVKGSAKPGGRLNCDAGGWSEDLSSASLYRAPTFFVYSWSRGGKSFFSGGAAAKSLKTPGVAEYRCTVTASNQGGSSSQTSTIAAVFKVGKPKRDRGKGTAKLSVALPGSGRLAVTGKGCRTVQRKAKSRGPVRLTIRAKGATLRKLKKTGSAKLKLKLAFTTSDHSVATQKTSVVLRKK